MDSCSVNPVKRRLSAPGRRKSAGIELKPITGEVRVQSKNGIRDCHDFLDFKKADSKASVENAPHSGGILKARARVMSKNNKPLCVPNFRAPAREIRSGEYLKGYTCKECERFAELLRSENVHEDMIQAASRHRYFCAPCDTPANLWEPWEIVSTPLTLPN